MLLPAGPALPTVAQVLEAIESEEGAGETLFGAAWAAGGAVD